MKGGSIPDAPDLSGNIANANQTFNTATSNAGQTFSAAQGLNDQAAKTLNSVTGEQLPMLNTVNNAAKQNLNTYQNTFQPLQQQQAQEAKDYTSGANIDMLRGRAVADSNASLEAQRRNHAAALASEGVDPATLGAGALDRQAAVSGAAQNAGAANNSYLNTMNTGRALTQQANQLGMQVGEQGNQQAGIGSGIGTSLVGAQTGANSGAVNNLTAANTYLNTGNEANKSSADIANSGFQDQMAISNAKDAATSSMIGNVASIAGMFMEKGGPVPAKGALPYSPKPGSTDTVPMMATPGEFVIPADVVRHKGNEFFHKLIDSTRLKANERTAIPKPVYAHQSNH